MRKFVLVCSIAVLGCLFPGCLMVFYAASARELADLNLTERITLTLANSISQEYQYGIDEVGDLMRRSDFYIDEEEGIYSYSFRIKEAYHPRYGTFDGSGYYRIASSIWYRKPKTEEGWEFLGEDEKTGAMVWLRGVQKSRAEKYNEVQASLKRGNLTLTVSLRRPSEELPEESEEAVLERFNTLIENAKKYGILCRIIIEMVEKDQTLLLADNTLVNIPGRKNKETQVPLRIYTVDYKGSPLSNIEYYGIKLEGTLGQFARIENATFNEEKHQYEVYDAAEAHVILVFPALEEEEFFRALEEDENLREGFGIGVNVNVAFKSERG